MKKLFFIPLILGIGIGFNSCNLGDTGNVTTYPAFPAVVDFNSSMGGISIGTPFGVFAAPSLKDVYPGDCLFLYQFTIDYDHQPSTEFYTATNIVKESVDQSYLEQRSFIELYDNTIPINAMEGVSSVNYNGKFFIYASVRDKVPNFRMIYNYEEQETNGVKNLYVIASSVASSSEDIASIHAFDLLDLIYSEGRDTTLTYSGFSIEQRYIKANLKYLSKYTEGAEPEYKNANDQSAPFFISILKGY